MICGDRLDCRSIRRNSSSAFFRGYKAKLVRPEAELLFHRSSLLLVADLRELKGLLRLLQSRLQLLRRGRRGLLIHRPTLGLSRQEKGGSGTQGAELGRDRAQE